METQGVQEGRQALHEYQNANGENGPEGKHAGQYNATHRPFLLQANR